MSTQKKDRGYSTLQLFLASFAFGVIMLFWTIYNAYVPLILDANLSALGGGKALSAAMVSTLTGAIMTIDNIFGLIFQPLFGAKSDRMRSRFGKRMPYVIAGIIVCSILFVLIPVAGQREGIAGITMMMVVIICFNLMMSVWRAPCVAIMPDIVPDEFQSDGNAVVNIVSAIFTIIASVAATILGMFGLKEAIESGDFRSVFLFGSCIAILSLVILLTCVKWTDNRGEKITADPSAQNKDKKKETLRSMHLPKDAVRSMLIMMVALFCISGASDGLNTYFTLYATKFLELSASTATLIKTAGTLGAVFLAVPAGICGRKLGRRHTIRIGIVLCLLVHVLLYLMPGFAVGRNVIVPLTIGYFVYAGGFIMVNINTLPIMLGIGGKEHYGAFTGYYYAATFTASVICPILIGALVGLTSYNQVHVFCFILMAAAMLLLFGVKHGDISE